MVCKAFNQNLGNHSNDNEAGPNNIYASNRWTGKNGLQNTLSIWMMQIYLKKEQTERSYFISTFKCTQTLLLMYSAFYNNEYSWKSLFTWGSRFFSWKFQSAIPMDIIINTMDSLFHFPFIFLMDIILNHIFHVIYVHH